ncbi:MAG: hypothetical protein GXP54_12630 [Deltaproteobacteria bacterium]|nr:hypothetical protein [Deltaproteobacteria bacterium]
MNISCQGVAKRMLWCGIAALALGCGSSDKGTDVVDQADALEIAETTPIEDSDVQKTDSSEADILDVGVLDTAEPDSGPTPVSTELLKGPWLQWVRPDGFFVMAESADEVPLKLEVRVAGELRDTEWSTPFLPKVVAEGLPTPELDGWLHEIEMTGVQPGESFEVLIVNTGDKAHGLVPEAGKPLKMAVFGDNRTQDDKHLMVVNAIAGYGPSLVVNSGDLTEIGGDKDLWTGFFQIEAPLISSAFYYPVFGNHENILGQSYFAAFFHTGNNYLNEGNWYTVVGDVGLLALNAYEPSDWSDPDALAWLDSGLAKLRQEAAWVLVTFHEPMYTFSNHGPWLKGRETVQPLFEKHHVDMVFSGHNHCYEHFLVNGIHYIVTGGGGAPLYGVGEGPPDEQDLLIKAKSFYHYLRLDVTKDSLDVSVVDATTGDMFEKWTLVK